MPKSSILFPLPGFTITDVDLMSLPRKTSNVSILGDAYRCVDSRRMHFFRGDLLCHLEVGREGFSLPSGNWYQPGLIDPAIAGETEHLVGMVFPEIRMSVNLTLIPASLGSFSDSRGLVGRG